MKIIYLDLDGVINSLSRKPPKQNTGWFGDWHEKRIEGYRILWSSELVDAITNLSMREDVTIKFLTTWRILAPTSFGPQVGLLGSTEWAFLDAEDHELFDTRNWWKLDRIQKDIEAEKPEKAVWIDDDIAFERNAAQWVAEQGSSLLAISPYSTHGVSKKEIDLITEFLDADPKTQETEEESVTVK